MADKYAGGCDRVYTHADNDPLDKNVCRCPICKRVTGQDSTSIVFFGWPARPC